jgi:hypothetical protein
MNCSVIIAGARTQPVVLALEDIHWADFKLVRSISFGASLSAALWPPCFFSLLPDPSSGRYGQFAHITRRFTIHEAPEDLLLLFSVLYGYGSAGCSVQR